MVSIHVRVCRADDGQYLVQLARLVSGEVLGAAQWSRGVAYSTEQEADEASRKLLHARLHIEKLKGSEIDSGPIHRGSRRYHGYHRESRGLWRYPTLADRTIL